MQQEFATDRWEKITHRRRLFFFIVMLIPAGLAGAYMSSSLPIDGSIAVRTLIVVLFSLLFGWISIGMWVSLAGLWQLLFHYDRFNPPGRHNQPVSLGKSRTAVLMPIYNEEIRRISAGLEVVYRSLSRTGRLASFDFFLLSDTRDPDKWIAEEVAWADLCARLDAFGRIHYRHRRPNIKRKSGNIADFCRRWGYRYDFMVILDADSIMRGDTIVHMVGTMIRFPRIGILQTLPLPVNRETLFARLQQFASRVYGPLLAAGLYFLQFGDAQYWGHNAIIRIRPFMRYCGLPKMPGKPPLGGLIMSHDFVEAALMRRAGWEVWLTYESGGSYEEVPPTLIDELQRDRRWCQGNLQHLRLLFTRGLIPTHRKSFINGALSYGSSLLWASYLCISTSLTLWQRMQPPNYFPETYSLFPKWPVWQWGWALILISSTLVILFLPKFMALFWILLGRRNAECYGGMLRLTISLVVESVMSALLAPIRMLFHARFVLLTLLGRTIEWNAQSRDDRGTKWSTALRMHAFSMTGSLVVGGFLLLLDPPLFIWLSPVLISLVIAPVLSVLTSKASVGRRLRQAGLLLTPEELYPPPELKHLKACMATDEPGKDGNTEIFSALPGFVRAVVDPLVNDLHISLLGKRRSFSRSIAQNGERLRLKALEHGPQALSATEKQIILCDPGCLAELHQRVWELSSAKSALAWGIRRHFPVHASDS